MLYIGQIILSKKKVSEEFFGKLVFMINVHARLLNNIVFPLSILLFKKQIFYWHLATQNYIWTSFLQVEYLNATKLTSTITKEQF